MINVLTDEVARRGYRKALIVTDSTLARCDVAAKVTDKLDAVGLVWDTLSDVIPNPAIIMAQQGLQAFQRSGVDYLIAVGDGSPQDICRATGIIQRNPEPVDVRSLEGLSPIRQPSMSIFTMPTAASIMAEVTISCIITDEEQRRKFACVDPHDIPQVAFIDVDMVDAMPPALKAATGVDASMRATEGYLTRGVWALTDALHLKAAEIIAGVLRGSVAGDTGAGGAMVLGQYVTGMGFSNIGFGLVYDMAHPLGALYNTPRGVVNTTLLLYAMRFSAEVMGEKYRDIAQSMGVRVGALSLTAACQAAVEVVCQLNHDVGVPGHLREVGVRKEDIPALTQAVLKDACTGGNSREASLADIAGLYQAAW